MLSRAAVVKAVLFFLPLLAAPVYLFWHGSYVPVAFFSSFRDSAALPWLEQGLRETLPLGGELERVGQRIRLFGGQREQNGIFIGEEALIRRTPPPMASYVNRNSEALVSFARNLLDVSNRKTQTYLAVIPTSGAILDQYLPRFAASGMVNQRRVIEDLYNQVSPAVRTMDVYSTLDEHADEYIYYRTEDNLSALGGYYAYYAMGRRLGRTNRLLNRYEVQYVDYDFYGDLYRAPEDGAGRTGSARPSLGNLRPDVLALYRYSYSPREYTVTHAGEGDPLTYHTLYPMERLLLGDPRDVYLGGGSARIDIVTSINTASENKSRLLVFGDKTAGAYLPFLLNHYQEVTFLDLSLLDESEIQALRPNQYDEALFAYGIGSYIHTDGHIARIAGIDWDAIYEG